MKIACLNWGALQMVSKGRVDGNRKGDGPQLSGLIYHQNSTVKPIKSPPYSKHWILLMNQKA